MLRTSVSLAAGFDAASPECEIVMILRFPCFCRRGRRRPVQRPLGTKMRNCPHSFRSNRTKFASRNLQWKVKTSALLISFPSRYIMRKFMLCLRIIFCILLSAISGICSSRSVILSSIEIFNTHDWPSQNPTIYFKCQGENITILPDVKEKHFIYKFKGVESWQPLAELADKKCKRCGFYELDSVLSDDVLDEWELCPDKFNDGSFIHYKSKEFNATFTCSGCIADVGAANPASKGDSYDKKLNLALAILVGVLTSLVTAAGTFGMYKYWQKRKREQNQARFLKLFEEGDDIEDELQL